MELFTAEQQEKIVHAISVAENHTSGEIRLAIEPRCKGEVLDRAVWYFRRLGMDRTALRNGVLIYMSVEDHQFAIIGDHGIDRKVPADFWEETRDLMLQAFRKDDLVRGLIDGITHAGKQLQQFFPRMEDDINELPNDVVFGKGDDYDGK
ncbi:TPM domain-containing protein [Parapedobacter lycopersici]|uniref:TPM domain-containing protein n=1 Tax=Parapedobacter lycopersici TaxID=1864939 RepID=UPI00334263B1